MQSRSDKFLTHLHTYSTQYLIIVLFLISWRKTQIRAGVDLAMGYDPGLYKRMALEVSNLPSRDRNILPSFVQTVYEPVSLILGGTRVSILGGRSDSYLTIGRLVIVLFLPLCVYTLGARYDKSIGIMAGLLCAVSLVQHHVYRRAYRKQLLGICMVCIVLAYRKRVPLRALIPPALVAIGINRASGILLGLWGLYILTSYIYHTHASYTKPQKSYTYSQIISGILIGGILCIMLYYQVMDEQIWPLLSVFMEAIDTPKTGDSYQSGGTFLTISEYIRLSRYTLIPGIVGTIYSIYRSKYEYISIPSLILLIRVFGQGFFFQRMIGYLDIWMILSTTVLIYELYMSSQARIKDIYIGLGGTILLTSLVFMLYGSTRIAQPLILPLEYEAIQELSQEVENDAVVIVSGIWYSPWVAGWMPQAEVIAPGVFDHQQWGALDEGRQDHRQDQTGIQKCENRARDFPELVGRPTYIWVGTKQMPDIYTGDDSCIQLIRDGKIRQWYKMKQQ